MRIEREGEWDIIHLEESDVVAPGESFAAKMLDESNINYLVKKRARVYKPNGELLACFVKHCITALGAYTGYKALKGAAVPTDNRGMAAGEFDESKSEAPGRIARSSNTRAKKVKLDGTVSRKNIANIVNSGIVGYFDKTSRFPYCRTTAYTLKNPDKFAAAVPFLREVNEVFKTHVPDRWQAQKDAIDQTDPNFFIDGTVFTTITVNKNFQTAVHTDRGDYHEGFGVLTAFRSGDWEGCYFVFPEWGIGFDMNNKDVLLCDVHEWHGNTPIRHYGKPHERISLVLYYRENMASCESPDKELDLAIEKYDKYGHS